MLGVTAIILALLIAAIPDVGRAEELDVDTNLHMEDGGCLQSNTFRGLVQTSSGQKMSLAEEVNVVTESIEGTKFEQALETKSAEYEVLGWTAFKVTLKNADGEQVSGSDCFSDSDNKWIDAYVRMAAKPVMVPMHGTHAGEPMEDARYEVLQNVTEYGGDKLSGDSATGVYFDFQALLNSEFLVIFYRDKSDSGETASTNATTGAGTGDSSSASDTASTGDAGDSSSASETASTASTGNTSSAADEASTAGTGSSETQPVEETYSFTVNDSPSYAFKIGLVDGAGASGLLFPAPTEGHWVLTVADNPAAQLRQICQEEVGLSSDAPYQGFAFSSLAKDLLPQSFPSGTTLLLTLPLPDSLNNATSIDVRKLTSGHAHKVQAQIIPTKDVTDATNNRNYVQIVIPNDKFELGVPYIMFETPDESDPGQELTIEVDTPRDTEPEEEVPVGTSVDVSEIWGLGTPTAQANSLEIADYRLLITRYTEPAKQQIYNKIVEQAAATGYKKAKSTIRVYDIRLKKTKDGVITYPETEQELDYGTVSITLPIQENLMENGGTIGVYTLRNGSVLEVLRKPAGSGSTVTFETSHFSQYALLYTKGTPPKPDPGSSKSSTSSSSSSRASTSSSSSSSASSATGSSSTATGASSSSNTGGSSTGGGGGGNRAGGDSTVDMPRTGDATTYKAIIIMILLAFGAFELISSIPAKKQQRS